MTLASILSRRFLNRNLWPSGGQPELSAALAEQLLEDGFEAASARMRSEVCRARPSKRVRTTTALVRRLSGSWSAFVEPIEGLNRSVYRV